MELVCLRLKMLPSLGPVGANKAVQVRAQLCFVNNNNEEDSACTHISSTSGVVSLPTATETGCAKRNQRGRDRLAKACEWPACRSVYPQAKALLPSWPCRENGPFMTIIALFANIGANNYFSRYNNNNNDEYLVLFLQGGYFA